MKTTEEPLKSYLSVRAKNCLNNTFGAGFDFSKPSQHTVNKILTMKKAGDETIKNIGNVFAESGESKVYDAICLSYVEGLRSELSILSNNQAKITARMNTILNKISNICLNGVYEDLFEDQKEPELGLVAEKAKRFRTIEQIDNSTKESNSEKQQIKTIEESNRILRIDQVAAMVGLSRSTLWRLEKESMFPKRKIIGARAIGWLYSDIKEWMTKEA